jgi:hypothetical protein
MVVAAGWLPGNFSRGRIGEMSVKDNPIDWLIKTAGDALHGADEAGKEIGRRAAGGTQKFLEGVGGVVGAVLEGPPLTRRDVFVIHGHDEDALHELQVALESWRLNPIVLKDQPGGLLTLKQKFEKYAYSPTIGFAVALFTPDDKCTNAADPTPRMCPRPNVMLELGFFMSVFRGERTCILQKGDVSIPSDLSGVLTVSMDHPAWKDRLVAELRTANVEVTLPDGNPA